MNAIDFPTLARAYEEMCLDQGMSSQDIDPDLTLSTVAFLFRPEELQAAEAELATLLLEGDDLDSPFCTLLCGCEDDWPPVQANTQRVVNALFEEV